MSTKLNQTTDKEFIEFCYHAILGRSPDKKGLIINTDAISSHLLSREELLIQFVTSDEFKSKLLSTEFVPSGHYYSAIPSIEERTQFVSSDYKDEKILGIDLHEQEQIELLYEFKEYYDQSPFPEKKNKKFRYYFTNPAYSYTDAFTLYSMIRKYKPERIIEIGSGFSSCVMLDTNDHYFEGGIDLIFIEPYPDLLYSLFKRSDSNRAVISNNLQEVNLDLFSSLEENDILFVDSTHVSKLNSDVNKIILEIIPSLKKGVLIHFHDIFWPFEYPKDWIQEGRAWNEAYILRAFLEFNDSFEILFFADYMHKYQGKWIQENMPLYRKNTGGNIWIRKVK